MQTLTAKQIKIEDLVEIDCGNGPHENMQWALVIDKKNPVDLFSEEIKENEISFFVKVGGDMFWTIGFSLDDEFNVLIKDPTIEVSIRG